MGKIRKLLEGIRNTEVAIKEKSSGKLKDAAEAYAEEVGGEAVYHNGHNCYDIMKGDKIIAQVYLEQEFDKDAEDFKTKYVKVEPGTGDYKAVKFKVNKKVLSGEKVLIKTVSNVETRPTEIDQWGLNEAVKPLHEDRAATPEQIQRLDDFLNTLCIPLSRDKNVEVRMEGDSRFYCNIFVGSKSREVWGNLDDGFVYAAIPSSLKVTARVVKNYGAEYHPDTKEVTYNVQPTFDLAYSLRDMKTVINFIKYLNLPIEKMTLRSLRVQDPEGDYTESIKVSSYAEAEEVFNKFLQKEFFSEKKAASTDSKKISWVKKNIDRLQKEEDYHATMEVYPLHADLDDTAFFIAKLSDGKIYGKSYDLGMCANENKDNISEEDFEGMKDEGFVPRDLSYDDFMAKYFDDEGTLVGDEGECREYSDLESEFDNFVGVTYNSCASNFYELDDNDLIEIYDRYHEED